MKHPKNKKMPMLCLALIIAVCVLTACMSSTAETVKVGSDEVLSLYSVAGEKKITGSRTGTENGVAYKSVTYLEDSVSEQEMQQYITALERQGYTQTADTVMDGTKQALQMANESVQDGKLVLVNIEFDAAGSTTLTYFVGEGTLTRN
ncbi:MAG TPA: hypothetical protein DEB31_01905 [Clostridiales bacterium]|nr:hypothetical protein [Clostridiales bacterium]